MVGRFVFPDCDDESVEPSAFWLLFTLTPVEKPPKLFLQAKVAQRRHRVLPVPVGLSSSALHFCHNKNEFQVNHWCQWRTMIMLSPAKWCKYHTTSYNKLLGYSIHMGIVAYQFQVNHHTPQHKNQITQWQHSYNSHLTAERHQTYPCKLLNLIHTRTHHIDSNLKQDHKSLKIFNFCNKYEEEYDESLHLGEIEWLCPCKRVGNRRPRMENQHQCLWSCTLASLPFAATLDRKCGKIFPRNSERLFVKINLKP